MPEQNPLKDVLTNLKQVGEQGVMFQKNLIDTTAKGLSSVADSLITGAPPLALGLPPLPGMPATKSGNPGNSNAGPFGLPALPQLALPGMPGAAGAPAMPAAPETLSKVFSNIEAALPAGVPKLSEVLKPLGPAPAPPPAPAPAAPAAAPIPTPAAAIAVSGRRRITELGGF